LGIFDDSKQRSLSFDLKDTGFCPFACELQREKNKESRNLSKDSSFVGSHII